MKTMTDLDITEIAQNTAIDARLTGTLSEAIAVGIRNYIALAAEPETPDRTGQFFRSATDPTAWYGPVTKTTGNKHDIATPNGKPWTIWERWILDGQYLRIPPLLPGMEAKRCAVPQLGEKWQDPYTGIVMGPLEIAVTNVDYDYEGRRWIEPKPAEPETEDRGCHNCQFEDRSGAEKPCDTCSATVVAGQGDTTLNMWQPKPATPSWPVGPFKVHEDQLEAEYDEVRDGNGFVTCRNCSAAEAAAIALALTEFWPLVAEVTEFSSFMANYRHSRGSVDALLDRIDAANFKNQEVTK